MPKHRPTQNRKQGLFFSFSSEQYAQEALDNLSGSESELEFTRVGKFILVSSEFALPLVDIIRQLHYELEVGEIGTSHKLTIKGFEIVETLQFLQDELGDNILDKDSILVQLLREIDRGEHSEIHKRPAEEILISEDAIDRAIRSGVNPEILRELTEPVQDFPVELLKIPPQKPSKQPSIHDRNLAFLEMMRSLYTEIHSARDMAHLGEGLENKFIFIRIDDNAYLFPIPFSAIIGYPTVGEIRSEMKAHVTALSDTAIDILHLGMRADTLLDLMSEQMEDDDVLTFCTVLGPENRNNLCVIHPPDIETPGIYIFRTT